MSRVSERQLVLPSLVLLNQTADGTMTTTELSARLKTLLNPTGDDLLILAGRNDDLFSQKVRNLKSHDTLVKQGFAEHIEGGFRITDAGRAEARRRAASIEARAGRDEPPGRCCFRPRPTACTRSATRSETTTTRTS